MMLQRLPGRWHKHWIYFGLLYVMVLGPLLLLNRYLVLGDAMDAEIALRILALSIILAVLINLSGWLGARWLWLFSSLGTMVGIVYMFINTGELGGWQDLISFISFMFMIAIGLITGIIVEIIAAFITRKKG